MTSRDEGILALYVDGALVSQKYVGTIDIPSDSTLVLGSRFPPSRPIAPGALANLSLRARVLSPSAIGRSYETTKPRQVEQPADSPVRSR